MLAAPIPPLPATTMPTPIRARFLFRLVLARAVRLVPLAAGVALPITACLAAGPYGPAGDGMAPWYAQPGAQPAYPSMSGPPANAVPGYGGGGAWPAGGQIGYGPQQPDDEAAPPEAGGQPAYQGQPVYQGRRGYPGLPGYRHQPGSPGRPIYLNPSEDNDSPYPPPGNGQPQPGYGQPAPYAPQFGMVLGVRPIGGPTRPAGVLGTTLGEPDNPAGQPLSALARYRLDLRLDDGALRSFDLLDADDWRPGDRVRIDAGNRLSHD
ncbi:hypothetical protein [Burkholderia glumae]|uniref:hypothetical protein n=1 Tax=Burkholderia glumae TaxID=337 RepID=UPI001E61D942|nr:hypothetical protein [Burkholderia glumae]